MRILKPNTGKETESILKSNVFVMVTDYKLKKILREIKVRPGQHTCDWDAFEGNGVIDMSDTVANGRYCSFDNAINKVVNDPYCTVYEFDSYEQMIKNWESIVYVDSIKTKYEGKEE